MNRGLKHISSVRAWHSKDVQEKVTALKERVFELLRHQSMTGSELNQHLGSSSAHKRLSELVDAGLIRQAEERTCAITSQHVSSWEAIPEDEQTAKSANKPSKPSKATMQKAFDQFVDLVVLAQSDLGYKCPTELVQLGAELRRKYGRKMK